MKTFFSEKHKLRDANTELYGGELVKPFERPQRLDFIVDEIKTRGLGEILNPNKVNLNIIGKDHDQDYIKFLDNAWNEWTKEGFKGVAIYVGLQGIMLLKINMAVTVSLIMQQLLQNDLKNWVLKKYLF